MDQVICQGCLKKSGIYDSIAVTAKTGKSTCRNEAIAEAFHYMHIVEAWGTRLPRIINRCKEYGLPAPVFEEFGDGFKVILFRKTSNAASKTSNAQEKVSNESMNIGNAQEKVSNKVITLCGGYTVIDKITVHLNIKEDRYEAEFSNLDVKNIPIHPDYPSKFDRLLSECWKVRKKDINNCPIVKIKYIFPCFHKKNSCGCILEGVI